MDALAYAPLTLPAHAEPHTTCACPCARRALSSAYQGRLQVIRILLEFDIDLFTLTQFDIDPFDAMFDPTSDTEAELLCRYPLALPLRSLYNKWRAKCGVAPVQLPSPKCSAHRGGRQLKSLNFVSPTRSSPSKTSKTSITGHRQQLTPRLGKVVRGAARAKRVVKQVKERKGHADGPRSKVRFSHVVGTPSCLATASALAEGAPGPAVAPPMTAAATVTVPDSVAAEVRGPPPQSACASEAAAPAGMAAAPASVAAAPTDVATAPATATSAAKPAAMAGISTPADAAPPSNPLPVPSLSRWLSNAVCAAEGVEATGAAAAVVSTARLGSQAALSILPPQTLIGSKSVLPEARAQCLESEVDQMEDVVEVDEHDLYDDYDLYEDKLTTHQRIQLKLRQLFSRAGSERNNRLKEGYMRQHAFAFFVLDQSLAHSDYPNHTRARYWLGKGQEVKVAPRSLVLHLARLRPHGLLCGQIRAGDQRSARAKGRYRLNFRPVLMSDSVRIARASQDADWMDLMMWSVLMGHFKLSRMLWLKTSTPLRAAVVAARLCQKMSLKAGPANVEALQEQSKVYESWALGILNQVTKSDEDVMNLLTCVPTRTIPNNSANPNAGKKVPLWSVSVLDEAGKAIYPCRSFVAHRHCSFLIDQYWHGVYRGSKAAIPEKTSYLRVLLHSVLHFVNLPFIICGCSLPASAFPIKVKQPHFFHAAREKEEEGQEDEDEDELEEDYFAEERAHDETALRQASFEYWLAYLNIPKVKFVFHAAASLATNVLLALWLCFQHSSGDPAYFFGERTGEVVHDWYVQYTLELVFWVCYAGRVIEETSQFLGSTPSVYFSQFWNRVDLTLVLVNSIALGLRVYDLLHLRPCVRDALATMHTDGAESQITHRYGGECTYDNWRAMDQLQRDFQVLGMVLLQFRYLEILTAASWFAEVWLVLVAMVADAGPVLFLMLFFALATGTPACGRLCVCPWTHLL